MALSTTSILHYLRQRDKVMRNLLQTLSKHILINAELFTTHIPLDLRYSICPLFYIQFTYDAAVSATFLNLVDNMTTIVYFPN